MLCPSPSSLTQGLSQGNIYAPNPVCSNSSRHIPDLEPLCPITWGCSQHRDSPGETSPVLASPLPSSTSAAFPKHAPCPQQIMSSNSFKLTPVWGAFLLEHGKQPNQDAVVHYPGWIFLAWQMCKLCLKYTLLTEMFPARMNPHFPVAAIWHRDCIDLLMDLTKGITWNACGCSVNEDCPPTLTAWTLLEMNQTTDASLQHSARGQSIKADFLYF